MRNLRYHLLNLEGCFTPVSQNQLYWLQVGDWDALKIRRHTVAGFAGQDRNSDSILDEIENAVGRGQLFNNVRPEPGLLTLLEQPTTQRRMRSFRTRNDQGTRSQVCESYLSGAVR
jgi:hypothetical protein